MSMEQSGAEVKYKVRLGRAGAVMMPSRQDNSAGEEEELGMTPSRGENEMRTVVEMLGEDPSPPQYQHRAQVIDHDEIEIVQEDESGRRRSGPHKISSVAPARPVLAKHVGKKSAHQQPEDDLKVENMEFVDTSRLKKRSSQDMQEHQDGAADAQQMEQLDVEDENEWKDGSAFEKQANDVFMSVCRVCIQGSLLLVL